MSEFTPVTNEKNVNIRNVRGIRMCLMGGNRSLDLCSEMNYETEVLDLIDAQDKGTVFYDLGACEGRFSIYAALKGLKVYAFEPDPNNFDYLDKNKNLNKLGDEQLQSFNLALGETDGVGTLKIGQPWPGGHQKVIENPHVRADLNFNFKESVEIEVVALDTFIQKAGLFLPHCLKIDIDGSERAFISGAGVTLKGSELKTLIIELETDDPNYVWIVDKLEGAGFHKVSQHPIPNEHNLYNFVFQKDD
jgi:FkbM family methyltransferase